MKPVSNTLILVLVLTGLIISLSGLTGLKTNADYRVYFDKQDNLLQIDNALAAQYSHLDSLLLILEAKDEALLNDELVSLYPALAEQFSQIAFVERIDGFFQFLENDDFFQTEFNLTTENESTAARLQRLKEHPRANNMISNNGQFGIIEIGVRLPGENAAKEVIGLMDDVDRVVNEQLNKLGSINIHLSGTLALNKAYIDVVRDDLKRFVPLLFIIFILSLFAFFRNWGVSFLLFSMALLTALSAFGIAGWFGWELAAINAFTPIIIMSLNIATAMHVVVNYFKFIVQGMSRQEAMQNSIKFNFMALTMSKLTTALGFLLLTFSPSPPVQIVGFIVAIGMVISYLICLSVLPTILPKLKLSTEQAKKTVDRFSLGKLGQWTLNHSKKLIVISLCILMASVFAIHQLQVNDNVYEYFPEDHAFRQGTQLINHHFDGSVRLFYSIDAAKAFAVLDSAYRQKVTDFTTWLRQHHSVARVDDVLSQAVKRGINFSNLRSFLEINPPYALGLEQQVSEYYDATKITVVLNNVTAREILEIDKEIKNWLDNNLSAYQYVGGVGPDLLFARLGERNAKSMFFSLSLALAVIALITGLLMRSFTASFMGLVCNLAPVVVVFAGWAMAGGYISLGSAMVMGMIMGIIVDDTLHMLLKYPRSDENSNTKAILSLFDKVSPAIVITSITLSAGLIVGLLSGFRPIYELSLLSLSTILVAMLANLLLLPALMKNLNFKRT